MNKKYMDVAFEEAKKAYDLGEVPIGAVIVKNDEIIAKAHNLKEFNKNISCHAEILAIINAEKLLSNWRLDECDIYVTLDPCPMCASAIKQSRIKNVYSALESSDKNYNEIVRLIFDNNDNTNKKVNFYTNLDVEKSNSLLSLFFNDKRN